jgi:hypothetical protein
VAGTPETDTAYGDFLRRAAPVFGDRAPVEEVGLYYSSSSQLVEMLPAWFRDFDNQRHSFSFYGWGAALTQLHVPWRAVPEWKLTPSALESLRLLVIPSAEVFPAEDLAVLEQWVGAGGALIIAGDCGTRLGEAGNLDPCSTGSTLASLREVGGEPQPRLLGAGKALALREDPGFAFYKAAEARPSLLAEFARTLARIHPPEANSLWAPDVSWKVGLTLYRDRSRIFVDVNNTDLDLEKDVIEPTLPLRFTVALPPELRGKELRTAVLSPDAVPQSELKPLADGRLEVTLGPVLVYASVLIEPAQSP